MDLLDRVREESRNPAKAHSVGTREPQRRKTPAVLLAGMSASLISESAPLLLRSEIADAAADDRTEDRSDEWKRDGHDGTDSRSDGRSLVDWILKHRLAPS